MAETEEIVTEETPTEEAPKEEAKETKPSREQQLESELAKTREELQTTRGIAETAHNRSEQLINAIREAAAKRSGSPENGKSEAERLRDLFDEDPVAATDQLFRSRVQPIYDEYQNNAATTNREAAAGRLNDQGWPVYEKRVDEFMAQMPLEVRAKPGAYDAAFRYIVSQNLDEEIERRVSVERERRSQSEGAGGAPPPRSAKPTLDPNEKAIMKEFGLNEDEWNEYRDRETEVERKEKK